MNTATKLFAIVFSFILSFGVFFAGNTVAAPVSSKIVLQSDDDGYRRERVLINGVWYIIVYDSNGGIVEVIIDFND